MIPRHRDNPFGLHQRYNVTKINGEPIDPAAVYFVLRLDGFSSDSVHIQACRAAARAYANCIHLNEAIHLDLVGEQLRALVNSLEHDEKKILGVSNDGRTLRQIANTSFQYRKNGKALHAIADRLDRIIAKRENEN